MQCRFYSQIYYNEANERKERFERSLISAVFIKSNLLKLIEYIRLNP